MFLHIKYSLRNFVLKPCSSVTLSVKFYTHMKQKAQIGLYSKIFIRGQRGNILNSAISQSPLAKFQTRGTIKGKGHPITGHVGPEGKYRYSYTPSLTSALDGRRWSTPRPGPLYAQERDPVPTVKKAEWASGLVWTGAENLAYIRSPNPSQLQGI
jgi:hypothetical protein